MFKKILMLSQTLFPPDIRLEKEIKSLNEAGYDVTVICNKFEKTHDTDYKYCKIERLSAPFPKQYLNKIINFPIFFNPRYLSKVFGFIIKDRPDYIHAHDLPMVPLALSMKLLFGIPVVYDMHENYPEALKVFKKKGLINFIFKNYRLAKILDKLCIKYSDKVITVVEENKRRLLKLGITPEKISVVSNTVDINTFGHEKIDARLAEMYNDKFVIIYAGRVNPERGLETPVLAVNMIRDKLPEILLIILGNGPSVNYLTLLAKENNVEDSIRFIPWVGHDKVNSYLSFASVCIIAWPNNEFTNTTVPHKLFEYMSQSKPVLVSDAEPLIRIVTETKCGRVFRSNNPRSFAEEIIKLKDDKKSYGENGRNAVIRKYNWQNDSKILINLYKNLN
jgi:glycosyltransferase involved in cell wall biosynthesis